MGFRNGKTLKDYLMGAALLKTYNAGGSELYGKGTYQLCDHIITANTLQQKHVGKYLKFKVSPLT